MDENRATFKPVTLISSASTENTEITINRQTKKRSLPTETSTLIESNDENSEKEPEPTSKKFAKIATDTQKCIKILENLYLRKIIKDDEKKEMRKQRAEEKVRRDEERCKLMSLLINNMNGKLFKNILFDILIL